MNDCVSRVCVMMGKGIDAIRMEMEAACAAGDGDLDPQSMQKHNRKHINRIGDPKGVRPPRNMVQYWGSGNPKMGFQTCF